MTLYTIHRAYEKAMDDYADRFDDGVNATACLMDILRCSIQMKGVDCLAVAYRTLENGFEYVVDEGAEKVVYVMELIRAKNKFAFHNLTPSHFRGMLLNIRIRKKDKPKCFMFGEVQFKLERVINLLHKFESHRHYEYFRTLVKGNVEEVDDMLNKLFLFVNKVCPVPVLMSLLIAVMDKGEQTVAKDLTKHAKAWKRAFARISKAPMLLQWTSKLQDQKLKKVISNVATGPKSKTPRGQQKKKEAPALPLDRTGLYQMAIQTVLRKWNPKQYQVAQSVFSKISCYNVFNRANARVFDENHIQAALTTDEERAIWKTLREKAKESEDGLPLIKVTEMSTDGFGKYQFKHLSFQEFMAAYETLHSGETEGERHSWTEAYEDAKTTASVPFCESLVRCYLSDGQITVDSNNLRESSLKVARETDTYLLRALASQRLFPTHDPINLSGCSWITDLDLGTWTTKGSQTQSITLRGVPELTDKGVTILAEACREVTSIDLSGNLKITDASLFALANNCNGLLEVNVYGCRGLTDAGLAKLMMQCPRLFPANMRFHLSVAKCLGAVRASHMYPDLIEVDLRGQEGVTDAGLAHLAKLHPSRVLSRKKGDTFLNEVAKHHPDLETIDLHKCKLVTEDGLSNLLQKCSSIHPDKINSVNKGDAFLKTVANCRPWIQEIDLTDCQAVTDAGLAVLMSKCQALHPDKVKAAAKSSAFVKSVAENHTHIAEIDLLDANVTDEALAALITKCLSLHPDAVKSKQKGPLFLKAVMAHRDVLEKINLQGCAVAKDEDLALLLHKYPNMHPDKILSEEKGDNFIETVCTLHAPKLTGIDLNGCKAVSDAALAGLLDKCKRLQVDSILSSKKGDVFLSSVGMKRPLTTKIDLRGCEGVTDKGLADLLSKCKDLDPDNILSDAKGGSFLLAVGEHRKGLEELDLSQASGVTDTDLAKLVGLCPHLHPDKIKSNKKGDAFCSALAKHNANLEEIELSNCKGVTDSGLANLLTGCTKLHPDQVKSGVKASKFVEAVVNTRSDLETIDLSNARVTDDELAKLIEKCPKLYPSKIKSNSKADNFLTAVAQKRHDLTEIDLMECTHVTDAGLAKLIEHCPNLSPDNVLSLNKGDGLLKLSLRYLDHLHWHPLKCRNVGMPQS